MPGASAVSVSVPVSAMLNDCTPTPNSSGTTTSSVKESNCFQSKVSVWPITESLSVSTSAPLSCHDELTVSVRSSESLANSKRGT
jgi:hypothetical protein